MTIVSLVRRCVAVGVVVVSLIAADARAEFTPQVGWTSSYSLLT